MALYMRPGGLTLEKKRIEVWHDTVPVYIATFLFCLGTLVFSLFGIKTALQLPDCRRYAWVPEMLLILSAVLLVPSAYRLLRRLFLKLR